MERMGKQGRKRAARESHSDPRKSQGSFDHEKMATTDPG